MKKIATYTYVTLILWQPVWHLLLPAPYGNQDVWLTLLTLLPLLIPAYGIVRGSERALIWGVYLVIAYFMFSIMEWWTIPSQWIAALVQLLLCCTYLLSLGVATRKRRTN